MNAEKTSAPRFRIDERFETGFAELALSGELDISVSDEFRHRLEELSRDGINVRLDLSALEFIDSSGIRVIIMARSASRRERWQLEVGTDVQPAIERVFDLAGVRSYIWPDDDERLSRARQ